jgi:hypothetical protein
MSDMSLSVKWPREAKRDLDEGDWTVSTGLALHRMDKTQAHIWNLCRSLCIAAANEATAELAKEGGK